MYAIRSYYVTHNPRFLIEIFHCLAARHPAVERSQGLLFIQRRSDVPVKNHMGFVEIDCRGAVWTGDEKLSFIRVKLAAALRTGEMSDVRSYHADIIME